jgi:hypothetical protein
VLIVAAATFNDNSRIESVLATHTIDEKQLLPILNNFSQGLDYLVRGLIAIVVICVLIRSVKVKLRHRRAFGEDLVEDANDAEVMEVMEREIV